MAIHSSFMTYYQVCNQINRICATSGAGTPYSSGAPEFTPGFQCGSCYSIFSFMCMFCRSLFVLLYYFFWPLYCLFFDLRILITSLISLNSSTHLTTSIMESRQSSHFQPINQRHENTKSLSIKTEYISRIFVRLVNIFNCLAYDWIKNQIK